MAAMMRPRRRGARKSEQAAETATEEQSQAPTPDEEPAAADAAPPEAAAPEAAPEPRPAEHQPAARRFIINLNMLSDVDVKFYTEGDNRAAVIAAWRAAIGRAKRASPEDAIEVVMGEGEQAFSYVLFLAEVTGFAVGPFEEESDAIPYTVNV